MLSLDTGEAGEITEISSSVLLGGTGSMAVKFLAVTLAGSVAVVKYSTDLISVREFWLSMPAAFFSISMDLGMLKSRPTFQPA
mmetsp:Transcript_11119/g.23850  ORF Transcript_11119/g.23850 Transcript_11119/m.23850 type:complete len:83 (-) Transcript_11119:289-537(-)